MGRGRQKAKHTKVARALKYSVSDTNYSELERELTGASSNLPLQSDADSDTDELSKWSEYVDDETDTDDEHGDYQPRRA